MAEALESLTENGDDVCGCDGCEGLGADDHSGVVVDDVKDFDVGAVGESPVCGVCLPAFVGEGCFETDVGGVGTFFGLWGDEPGSGQGPPNC